RKDPPAPQNPMNSTARSSRLNDGGQADRNTPPVDMDPIPTLLLLGNAGAGKSTLLTQLGGENFGSGVKFRQGFTKNVTPCEVELNGQRVRLMDVPGLFEPNNGETEFNAGQLTKALGQENYSYRIYFVLKASNRGPDDKEMVMMAKINECVKKYNGSAMSFGVIVNQMRGKEVEVMYEELARDNFKGMFAGLVIPGFTFDINIDSVITLHFDEEGLKENKVGSVLAEQISMVEATAITLKNGISFCNDDVNQYAAGRRGSASESHSKPPVHGNSGAGKSTLLTQLGATTFPSGAQFRKGYTKDVHEEEIMLGGEKVLLVDVPGLYEPNENETQFNARKLTQALSKGYDYKLYFVLKASNRGPNDYDLLMMSKINECIKQANGSRVSFRLIVNQIMDQGVYDMYKEGLQNDNCRSLFATMHAKIPGFSFDIQIDNVMLLMFDEKEVGRRGFADRIAEDVLKHKKYAIMIETALQIGELILQLFQAAMHATSTPFASAAATAADVVTVMAWKLYQAHRDSQCSI
ncbi:hypothetical protein BG006_002660, partial [Podila minutissima]